MAALNIQLKCKSDFRSQRKVKAFEWSDYYLERVGFELSLNMRRHLKYGQNVIGRSTNDSDVDICVDSLECSRRHCNITISGDGSAILKDLNVKPQSA